MKNIQKDSVKAAAIGNFDGIHKGHKELIKRLGVGGALIIIESQKANITPGDRREEYAGVPCFYYDLGVIKNLRGEEFLELLKRDFPNLKRIVVGYDFKFGLDRAWDKHDLKNLFDGEVVFVDEFSFDGLGVHSSAIRRFLRDGDIYRANRLLGREYSIKGEIISGQGLGKTLLYPTINILVSEYILPKDGVYATRTRLGEATFNSVTFIGNRGTDGEFSVESHILDDNFKEKFEGQDFGKKTRVCFIERIRDNRHFDDLAKLKTQIAKDIAIAKNVAKACDLTLSEDTAHSRDIL